MKIEKCTKNTKKVMLYETFINKIIDRDMA